eukprot:6185932-Pleurochrysis_carterae.AAC.1
MFGALQYAPPDEQHQERKTKDAARKTSMPLSRYGYTQVNPDIVRAVNIPVLCNLEGVLRLDALLVPVKQQHPKGKSGGSKENNEHERDLQVELHHSQFVAAARLIAGRATGGEQQQRRESRAAHWPSR